MCVLNDQADFDNAIANLIQFEGVDDSDQEFHGALLKHRANCASSRISHSGLRRESPLVIRCKFGADTNS